MASRRVAGGGRGRRAAGLGPVSRILGRLLAWLGGFGVWAGGVLDVGGEERGYVGGMCVAGV